MIRGITGSKRAAMSSKNVGYLQKHKIKGNIVILLGTDTKTVTKTSIMTKIARELFGTKVAKISYAKGLNV